MLAGVQHEPVELNGSTRQVTRDRSGQGPLPGLVGGTFEPLKQLETGAAQATHDGLGGFDGRRGIPGRVGMLDLGGRRRGLAGVLTQRLADGR